MTRAESIAELERELGKLEKIVKRRLAAEDLDDLDDDDADNDADNDDEADEYGQLRADAEDDNSDDDDNEIDKSTKFEAMVNNTAAQEGCSKTEAARRVRQRYPDLAHGYDDLTTAKSYRSLVDTEIRKGFSPTVAAQRIAYSHPHAARSGIAKAETGAVKFMRAVDTIMKRDGISRVRAMATARRENPAAFKRFQNV